MTSAVLGPLIEYISNIINGFWTYMTSTIEYIVTTGIKLGLDVMNLLPLKVTLQI